MRAAKTMHRDRGFVIVAAGPRHDWERLDAAFSKRPFILVRASGELRQILNECRKLAPCTLLGDYDVFLNPARKTEFSRFLQFEKSVSVLIELREEKPDDVLGQLLQFGCMGFVPAGLPARPLRRAVRAVRSGEIWAPRRLLSAVLQNRYGGPRSLTAREWEILSLVAQGLSNRAISDVLQIAHETVRWNMRMIYKKLDVHDRKSVILRAFGTNARKPLEAAAGRAMANSQLAG
jgi:DNA-binding NarL/FixJ family response regulator